MNDNILSTSEDGTIIYEKLSSKYVEQACRVTRQTLFTSGNVSRALGVPDDPEAQEELDQLSLSAIKDGVSIIAVDRNTNRVVGVAINKFLIKSQPFFEQFRSIFKNEKARKIIEFVVETDSVCDIFEHCGINCVMELLFLGTLPNYRKKGIAKRLSEISLDVAQNLRNGINVKKSVDGNTLDLQPVPEAIYGIFTSPISQRISRDLGFERAVERTLENTENVKMEPPTILVAYKLLQSEK